MYIYHLYIFGDSSSYYFNKKPTKKQVFNLGIKKGHWESKEDLNDHCYYEIEKLKVIDLNK